MARQPLHGKPSQGMAHERRAELETDEPAARLRLIQHRGVVTTAIIGPLSTYSKRWTPRRRWASGT